MVFAAFIGRLPLSMVGLGSVLLVASETGSYGLGGAVAAAGAVTTAIAGPVLGRWADTHGERRVVLPLPAAFVVSRGSFLFSLRQGWPPWAGFLSARLARAPTPPGAAVVPARRAP